MPTLVAVLDATHVVPSPKDKHPAPSSMCYCGAFDAKAPGNIGRVAHPGLHIPDLRVSEVHAVVQFEKGQYILQDRGSTNGTEVLLHGSLWRLDFDPKNPAMNDRHALADHEQFFVGGVPVFFFLEDMNFDQAHAAGEERRALGIRRAETYPPMARKNKGQTM